MRASRLLSLLLLLQNRGQMTAPELAAELEVSVRTVYRDVEALSAAGVPVYAERGPAGGYRLVGGYRTRLTGLTADEAESLFLAGMPGPAAELGLGAVLTAAELKLHAALPDGVRDRAGRLRERFHLDTGGWFREPDQVPLLAAVADAVWRQQVLRVRYRRWGRDPIVDRTLHPLGVVLKSGLWYLVAAVPGGAPRTYRVTRIQHLRVLPEVFDRPAGFDLAEFWTSYAERFESGVYTAHAVLRLDDRARTLIPHLFPAAVRRAVESTSTDPDDHGWCEAIMPIESFDHALVDLMKLGPHAVVLAPPQLRDRMRAAVAEMALLYDTGSGQGPVRDLPDGRAAAAPAASKYDRQPTATAHL